MKIDIGRAYEYLFVLMLVNNWWGDLQVFQGIYPFVKPIILGLSIILVIKVMIKKMYTIFEFMFAALIILVGIYTSYITGSRWILYLVLLIVLSKKADRKRLVVITYRCMSIFLVISVFIFMIQYIGFPDMVKSISHDGMTKYSMTFIGANEAARYWIYWVLLKECIATDTHMTLSEKILIVFGTLFFYTFTRSDALLAVVIIVLLKYMKKNKKWEWIVKKFSGYTFLLIWGVSVLILKFQKTRLFILLNAICTGRLLLGISAFRMYGVTLAGRRPLEFYQWIDEGINGFRLVVDNAYYMIMIQYGIIYLLLISFIFIRASKRCSYLENVCFIIYALFALAENVILSPTAIFPVIIAANACWKQKKGEL